MDKLAVALAPLIYPLVFSGQDEFDFGGQTIYVNSYAQGACQGVRLGIYLFISQNPNKSSVYAARAREGKHIMWVINTETNQYLARVEEGELTQLVKL